MFREDYINTALAADGIMYSVPGNFVEGVAVVHAPRTMKACNLIGGGSMAVMNLNTGEPMPLIMYDDCYEKLNQDGKDYLIYHELSHIQHGDHLRGQDNPGLTWARYRLACRFWIPKIEILADLGCVKKIGFKRTIKGMLNLIRTVNCASGYFQCGKRIIALSVCNAIGTIVK